MDVVADLEVLVARSVSERSAAEIREQRARALLAETLSEREGVARARAALAERVEATDAGLRAGRDHLGPCRLEHGRAERELEALGDRAAAGSDPAARSLARQRDVVETAAEIVQAHERRVAALAREYEVAERDLAAFDAERAERVGVRLEGLLLAGAEHVDELLREAGAGALRVRDLVERRRALKPAEAWKGDWGAGNLHQHLTHAFLVAAAPAETNFARNGPMQGRGFRSFAQVVGSLVGSWRAGRGRSSSGVPAVEGKEAA
jgi:hypothetical protein